MDKRVLRKVGQIERFQQSPAVDVRICAHAAIAIRSQRRKLGDQTSFLVK